MTLAFLLFIGSIFRFIFTVLWILLVVYTLLELLKSSLPQNTKLLWLLVILFFPIIGSLIYLFVGRSQRI